MQSELLENEIRPGEFQSSVRKAQAPQERQRHKARATVICPFRMKILKGVCLLNAALEHSRTRLVFETRNDFIFGMLYQLS